MENRLAWSTDFRCIILGASIVMKQVPVRLPRVSSECWSLLSKTHMKCRH